MKSSEKIVVGCDLFLPLRLYQVPAWGIDKIKRQMPNVEITPVNLPGQLDVREDIDVYWGNRITREFVDRCWELRWIHFGSVGVDRALNPSVIDREIIVTSSRGLATASMAGAALSMITGLARGLPQTFTLRGQRALTRESFDKFYDQIHELEGQEILIVGLGGVGQRLAKVCKALGMSVRAVKRNTMIAAPDVEAIGTLEDLREMVGSADYVVNLLPLNAATFGVFNEDLFGKMRNTAFFINLGRGETVVETDMVSALLSGSIAGAGLDVFEVEPLPSESPLWRLDNVILTPHVGGLGPSYWVKQVDLFLYNLQRFVAGDFSSMKNIEEL